MEQKLVQERRQVKKQMEIKIKKEDSLVVVV
jgi:hypothetical protein